MNVLKRHKDLKQEQLNHCHMQTVITTIFHLLQVEKFVMELGAVEGPEMTFMFESHTVSIETPTAVSGWRIVPQMTDFQVLKFW